MTSIKDATVFITGANGGLGTELVKVALERGAARVYAASRSEKDWDDERVVAVKLDLTDPEAIQAAAALAGDTTILVNNAATFPRGDLLTAPLEEITGTIEANLTGPIHLTRLLAPALRAAKGSLVNVNSVLSWFAVGKAHSVSKAGLWMATNAFRLEFTADGVQVLGVYPGPIDTPMQPGPDRADMANPTDIAGSIYDAVESGEDELVVGEMAQKVHSALSAPIAVLYPMLPAK